MANISTEVGAKGEDFLAERGGEMRERRASLFREERQLRARA